MPASHGGDTIIQQLGRQLVASAKARDAACRRATEAPDGSIEHRLAHHETDCQSDVGFRLSRLLTTFPPASVSDVVVQVSALAILCESLEGDMEGGEEEAVADTARRVVRCLHAAVPILATVAGLDIEAMDWREHGTLAAKLFAEPEAQL